MAYSRGQPNFISAVDARAGHDHGSSRAQNEVHTELSRHPVNIPVIAASGPRYSSATYPGFRGGAGSIAVDTGVAGRQQINTVVIHKSMSPVTEPPSTQSFQSSAQVPLCTVSKNFYNDAVVSQNSTSLPSRKRSDGSVVPAESYPTPVSSQIVYTTRVMPGGTPGAAGKVAVASSRRTVYQPGVMSDATPINQPQLRQIPVVVVPSQATRSDSRGELHNQRILRQSNSSQDAYPVTNKSAVSVSRSRSVDQSHSKEAEVDALTDLLVQNMNVAGNPDFCGMCVKCGRSVMGEKSSCVALDQLFHVDCFRCTSCNNCLSGQPFFAMEGQPYCELCYMQTLEKCSVCSKPIVDRMLRATGKPYHPRCFTCVVCGKNLDGLVFTVDATNQIHCIDDFHRKFAPRCSVCSLPIMPSDAGDKEAIRIVVLDRNFHLECFRCEDCGLVLSSDSDGRGCYPLDDHILCKMCNARRIQILTGKVTTDL